MDHRVRIKAAPIRLRTLLLCQLSVRIHPFLHLDLLLSLQPFSYLLPPASTAEARPIDPEEAAKLRAKYRRFCILVIGRANAGKTTLLKRVCNTTEDPCIYDEEKNLVSNQLIV